MSWKKETQSSIATRIKRISDKHTTAKNHNNNIDILHMPSNYYDSSGVPQPHIDGEPQDDYVYDYYIDRNIVPPWFEEYRSKQQQYENAGLTRAKDETAYLLRKYFREHGNYDGCTYNYNKTF